MYSADGIGRTGHRLLALALFVVGGLGMAMALREIGMPTGYLLYGFVAIAAALLLLTVSLWTVHRAPVIAVQKPSAAKVPTPPLEPKKFDDGDTLFDYDDLAQGGTGDDRPLSLSEDFVGAVPRGAVVDERPPAPPVPEVVQTRHDFTAKYTQSTPQVREILTHTGTGRPNRITAQLADPSVHPKQLPPATMRGKCGDCGSLLLAPTHRPIELECPECSRVTLLE